MRAIASLPKPCEKKNAVLQELGGRAGKNYGGAGQPDTEPSHANSRGRIFEGGQLDIWESRKIKTPLNY